MTYTLELIKCALCSFSSKKNKIVEKHIECCHNVTARELFIQINGVEISKCKCGCGRETTWLGWKHGFSSMIAGHNANIYTIYDQERASQIAKTRGSNWRGKEHWSKGQTKETNERVASRGKATSMGRTKAFAEGSITIWCKGQTKESDERIKIAADNLKLKFKTGIVTPWAKGLSKETDDRVAKMAATNSLTHSNKSLRKHLDDIKRHKKEEILSIIESSNTFIVLNDLSDYKNDQTPNIYIQCKSCGNQSYDSLRNAKYGRCKTCDPSGSCAQIEISSFIESLGFDVHKNTRNIIKNEQRGIELDIYVPERKLAIEYNGLYWHSEIYKSNFYHQNKSNQCLESKIQLIHIFEDDWLTKKHIVQSILKHSLEHTEQKIGARSCKIVELNSRERKTFFENNHIDGDVPSSYCVGLQFDNKIVMAMSVRKPFHKKYKSTLEIARVCTHTNVAVVGGLSKLTSSIKKWAQTNKYQKLISYIDTRLGSDGDKWTKCGWSKISETPPRFWWTDMKKRFNRFKYKADNANNKSEKDIALEAGVVKIFGCKNLVMELHIEPRNTAADNALIASINSSSDNT